MVLELGAIKEAVTEVAKANGASMAVLFGSYARGTATKRSDVDVIFVEETDARFLDRLGKYMNPLYDRLRTGVEVLVYTPAEFERMKERSFVRRALREGVLVYER